MSFNSFDISASGLYAQRLRMDTISSNIANINTTRKPDGTPGAYARKEVVFSAVYKDQLSEQGGISKDFNPAFNSTSGNMTLKGGVSFDAPTVSDGVEVAEIAEDKKPFKMVYDPSHPDANDDGFVEMPNINIVNEMVQMVMASRAYEANVTAVETAKVMLSAAMKI